MWHDDYTLKDVRLGSPVTLSATVLDVGPDGNEPIGAQPRWGRCMRCAHAPASTVSS